MGETEPRRSSIDRVGETAEDGGDAESIGAATREAGDAESTQARERLRWLIIGRWVVVLVAMGALLVVEYGGVLEAAPYAVLTAAALANFVYLGLLRRVRSTARFAAVQIGVDVALVAVLVYLTGGVYSFGALLYFGAVLAASRFVSGAAGIVVASSCSLLLALVQIAYHLASAGILPSLPLVSPDVLGSHRLRLGREAAYLITQALALHAVALLASWLGRELSRVQTMYREILERMAEGLVAVDHRGRIAFINSEARRLLGDRRTESLVGRRVEEVFRRAEDRTLLRWLQASEPVTAELNVHSRTGRPRQIQVKTSQINDAKNRVRATIAIFSDLTLNKQIEEIERRAERLEEIETLALGIAHEVRNPLASIRGCVQELGRVEYLDEDERRLAAIVCRESDRLDAIIGDFLKFARLKPPVMSEVDLVALLEEVIELLRRRNDGAAGADRNVQFQLRVERDSAPQQGEQRRTPLERIEADRELLMQLFLNLGINALDAMGNQGGRLRIYVRSARLGLRDVVGSVARTEPLEVEGGKRQQVPAQDSGGIESGATTASGLLREVAAVSVLFHDTGPGFDSDRAAHAFTPFFTTKAGGTGLGLAMAARIVKAHGGSISIESGSGGRVRVVLPRERRDEAASLVTTS